MAPFYVNKQKTLVNQKLLEKRICVDSLHILHTEAYIGVGNHKQRFMFRHKLFYSGRLPLNITK